MKELTEREIQWLEAIAKEYVNAHTSTFLSNSFTFFINL